MKVADMSAEQKVKYMTTEPIGRLVSQMAIPTIISMLVTSFYNMVDTMFVGRINTQSTAAVGIVFSVMAIIQACGRAGLVLFAAVLECAERAEITSVFANFWC